MPLKIPFWQVVTYMPTNVREPTYDVVKSAILNGKIITNLDPYSEKMTFLPQNLQN